MDHIFVPLKKALSDQNAYVRKTAVMGCVKVFYLSPKVILSESPPSHPFFKYRPGLKWKRYLSQIESGIVDKLFEMLRDKDAIVIGGWHLSCFTQWRGVVISL